MTEYGVVFTGGGTKGAYEVGAWKAIKELKLNVTGITGTSIGAINAALAVQDDISKMEEIYRNIDISNVISIREKINKNKNIFNIVNITKIAKDFYRQKGFDNAPLREMIINNIDIDKIYKSNVNLGVVSYVFKSKEPIEVFKEDIPKESFVDYLLASACFPIYKAQDIDGNQLIDGGFYDNMPINMLIRKGYKNIIVIDISGIGFRKKIIDKNTYVKIIKNSEDLGGTFNFNKQLMENNVKLGYLDTLKAFNKLQGHMYYFEKKEFSKLLKNYNLDTIYGFEQAAKIYKIDKYRIYKADEFLELVLNKHNNAKLQYGRIKSKLSPKIIIKEFTRIISMINKGLGICLFSDIIKSSTNYNIKMINNLFSDYITASKAMIELEYNSRKG